MGTIVFPCQTPGKLTRYRQEVAAINLSIAYLCGALSEKPRISRGLSQQSKEISPLDHGVFGSFFDHLACSKTLEASKYKKSKSPLYCSVASSPSLGPSMLFFDR